MVELPVPAAGEAVPGPAGAGHLDRGDAGVGRERGRGRKPARPSGASQQPAGDDRPHPRNPGQPGTGRGDGVGDIGGESLQTLIGGTNLSDQVPGQLLTGGLTGPAGRTAVSSRDAVAAVRSVGRAPGTRSRNSACSWLTSRVR